MWRRNSVYPKIKMYPCHGKCGTSDCTFVADSPSHLRIHADPEVRAKYNAKQRNRTREKVTCSVCQKKVSRWHISAHMIRKHNKRKRVVMSKNTKRWMQLVNDCITSDTRAARGGDIKSRRAIVDLLDARYAQIVTRGYDDNGGNVTGITKITLDRFSLMSVILDRIDDALPHFVNDSLDNILITIRGMGSWSSIYKGKDCCAKLRAEMLRDVSQTEIDEALQRERLTKSRLVAKALGCTATNNRLYQTSSKAFQDPKAKAAFGTRRKVFDYSYDLFVKAGARCAHSGIFFSGYAYNRVKNANGRSVPHPFQPSLDAVDPTKGHVPGNLRLVCACLNNIDMTKMDVHKALRSNREAPQQWTRALWRHYVGLQ